MTEQTEKSNWLTYLWKHPVGGYIIKAAIVAGTLFVLDYLLQGKTESIMKALVYILIGLIAAYLSVLEDFKKVLNNTKDEVEAQNQIANEKLIEIATKSIEEKIFRKLVSTNAIISDHDKKLSITARVMDDFHDKSAYENPSIIKDNTESIDLIRMLSYQNLLLTPKYLEYFYYRKDSVKKATRIVVLDREQMSGKICQATLTYLFISARYGYETYILPEVRFKKIIKEKSLSEQIQKIIKGNPFMLKIEKDSGLEYEGEYTDYRENIENNGMKESISGVTEWDLLENIKKNSAKIVPHSTGFSEYIQSCVSSLNMKPIN